MGRFSDIMRVAYLMQSFSEYKIIKMCIIGECFVKNNIKTLQVDVIIQLGYKRKMMNNVLKWKKSGISQTYFFKRKGASK